MALASRLKRPAHGHPARAELLRLLRRSPGLELAVLAKQVPVPRATARHHIRILERAGFVERFEAGGRRLVRPVGTGRQAAARAFVLRKPGPRLVFELLRGAARPRTELVREALQASQASTTSIYRWLDKLEAFGVVAIEGRGAACTIRPLA